ncbi:MAG: hypothetical protein C5B51_06450 [Terriglobia bacterium]|nr:MAG: hypothetical protein C5B51_06450 [Terriglobia bacterium]
MKWLWLVVVPACSLSAQRCDSEATFDGPLAITKGGTYTGNWQSTDSKVPAVMILTTEPVTILNSRLKGPGFLLTSYRPQAFYPAVSLVVQGTCFAGTNPNLAGMSKLGAMDIFQPVNLLVESCDFESTGIAVNVDGYRGDRRSGQTIKILKNRFHNIDSRTSDGNGGYQIPQNDDNNFSHGVLLNQVQGVPGIEVAWNQIVNEPDQSWVGDSINIYKSSGTVDSPIQVHDNYIQGGYAYPVGNAGLIHYSGSAIITDGSTGETNPDLATSFVTIHDNQGVSLGNAGFAIADGHHIEMYSNRLVSGGQLSDGTNITVEYGNGIEQFNNYHSSSDVFGGNSIHDNFSGYRRQRNGNWERADYYFSVPPAVSADNSSLAPTTAAAPTLTDEANELLLWKEKLIANAITLGSTLVPPAVSGSVQILSGNNQVGVPKATLPAQLVARVVNPSGSPVPGVNVSFMVATGNATASKHFTVTDENGLAKSAIILGIAPAAVKVNVIAAGYTGAKFSLWITQPPSIIIGIAGVGGSVPAVKTVSQRGLISIYGQGFLPTGATGRRVLASELVNGGLPTVLLSDCVEVGGQRAAMLDVFPTQINAQVPTVTGASTSVGVLTNCGTPAETASAPQTVAVSMASPEFLYFQTNANGTNPVVLVNAITGALVGPSNILSGVLTPARAGDVLTAYGTGFGAVTPPLATGQIPHGMASAVGLVSVSIGGVALATSDILYAGAAPGQVIDQLNFRVPAGVAAGNQPIVISVEGVNSPPNAFVAIQP